MANRKNEQSNSIKSCTLFVDGMHCASCEVLIEKKLLKQAGVEAVDASLRGHRVEINYVGKQPDVTALNTEFRDLGYSFSTKKFSHKHIPLISIRDGHMRLNQDKLRNLLKLIAIFASLIVAFFAFESLQLGQYVSVDASSALPAFLVLGIVAGLSSCAALIGGLLLSMTKQWNELYIDADSSWQKASPHILFHFGRLIAFALFGGVLGLLGGVINFSNTTIFAILTILVSGLMLVLALQMLEVSWAQRFRLSAPKLFTRFVADETNFQGRAMPFIIGALTFLLPCGFTLIAQTVALTSGSFLRGSLIMLLFALGTLPTLAGISLSGIAFNARPHLTAKFNLVAGLVILFFVLYNVNGQLNVLGLPSLSDIQFTAGAAPAAEEVVLNADGEQVLAITAKGFNYIPTGSMIIKAGIPTKLIVDNQGIAGCGAFMAAQGLIPNFVSLKSGINEIALGEPKKGTYKLTCTMGMVPPVTIQVI